MYYLRRFVSQVLCLHLWSPLIQDLSSEWQMSIYFYFLAGGYGVFASTLWLYRVQFFQIYIFWHFCLKWGSNGFVELFLGPLFCDIALYFKFCTSTTDFITLTLKYDLNSGALIPPASVFFCLWLVCYTLFMVFKCVFQSWFYFHKIRIVMGISLALEINFNRTQIFRVFILTIWEHGGLLHHLVSSSICFFRVIEF